MNKILSFEICKLLKEKSFNLKVVNFYNYEKLSLISDKDRQIGKLINYNPINWNSVNQHYTSAPTIAEVLMWCFNKYKYSIEYSMNIHESGEYDGCYVFNGLIKGSEDCKLKVFYTSKDYPTIEKALEDTIHYFLVNIC